MYVPYSIWDEILDNHWDKVYGAGPNKFLESFNPYKIKIRRVFLQCSQCKDIG